MPHDGVAVGEFKVRGAWVLERYYGADHSALDADGWFATGDVGTIDADGYALITDRIKDVIKSGGEWISSIALEKRRGRPSRGAGSRGDRRLPIRNGKSARCCWCGCATE